MERTTSLQNLTTDGQVLYMRPLLCWTRCCLNKDSSRTPRDRTVRQSKWLVTPSHGPILTWTSVSSKLHSLLVGRLQRPDKCGIAGSKASQGSKVTDERAEHISMIVWPVSDSTRPNYSSRACSIIPSHGFHELRRQLANRACRLGQDRTPSVSAHGVLRGMHTNIIRTNDREKRASTRTVHVHKRGP